MMDIALVEVDFDDLTTNVRWRRALAIAKPTPIRYWPCQSTINLTTRVYFLQENKEQARNWDCNLDIVNIRGKLYWSRWGSVTPLFGRWTQTKYAKLQLWRTFNLNKTQSIKDYGGRGGNFVALEGGSETNPNSCFPTHTISKNSLYLSITKLHVPGPIIRWRGT